MKTAQTVLGPVPVTELAPILIHEHVICTSPVIYRTFGEKWFSGETLRNETVRKLWEMHLGVMAEAFSAQLKDTQFQAAESRTRSRTVGGNLPHFRRECHRLHRHVFL